VEWLITGEDLSGHEKAARALREAFEESGYAGTCRQKLKAARGQTNTLKQMRITRSYKDKDAAFTGLEKALE
jgi:hypothetical protein